MILVNDIKSGNFRSFERLAGEFNGLIWKYTNMLMYKFPYIPLEKEDIHQQLTGSFWKLITKFKDEKKKSFPAYIKQFLLWEGHSDMRTYVKKSMAVMNYASSHDDDSFGSTPDYSMFEDYRGLLTKSEYEVMELLIEGGYTPKEVSVHLGKTIASVYQMKHRAIKRLRDNRDLVGI